LLHQVGDLFELNVQLQCQKVKFIFPDISEECTASICHHPLTKVTLFSHLSLAEALKWATSKILNYLTIHFSLSCSCDCQIPSNLTT